MSRLYRIALHAAALLLAIATPALAAGYETQLDPTPFEATSRANVIGSIGSASATLNGNVLTVNGSFSGLTSPATAAQVRVGLAMGVPGDAIGDLTVAHTQSGAISGSVKLNGAQIAALHKKAVYIRIDSEKAPDGNLQGWLEATGNN